MKITASEELISIFRQIVGENKTVDEWAEIESDDMFQTENYCGGFDATELAFCFSYVDKDRNDYWFQLTLDEIQNLVETELVQIELRPTN